MSLGLIAAPSLTLPRWKSGRYYDFKSSNPATASTGALAANTIYGNLQWFTGQPIDRIGTSVTTGAAAGKLLRCGIATMGADGLPDVLLVDSGNLAAEGIAGVEATVAVTPPMGWAWTLLITDGTPTVVSYAIERMPAELGWSSLTSTAIELCITKSQTFGAFPASFGAITAYSSVAYRVSVRAA